MRSRRIRFSLLGLTSVLVVAILLVWAIHATGTPGASGGTVPPGDRRVVTQPVIPSETCQTVPAALNMPDSTADDQEESSPPDTARLQQALDDCAQSGDSVVAVRLTASGEQTDFLSGPLKIRRGEVLVLDPQVTLFASRNPADYQLPGLTRCGTIGGQGDGCAAFITVSAPHAGIESSPAADGRQGRIDGRGGSPMLGSAESWWQLASEAKGKGNQNAPRLIQAQHADDFTLSDIDLVDAAHYHVVFKDGDGFTAWGVRIHTPATARNTDGIDPDGASDVTIAHSWIMDGDDGVAIAAQSAPSEHISIIDDHFFGTHGISIGSETTDGVRGVLVQHDQVVGTDADGRSSTYSSGIRIKSSPAKGGVVQSVAYRDICVTDVAQPISIDTHYLSHTGIDSPWFRDISVEGLSATDSPHDARSVIRGLDAAHPVELRLTNVAVDAPTVDTAFADIAATNTLFGGAPLRAVDTVSVTAPTPAPEAVSAPACMFASYPSPY